MPAHHCTRQGCLALPGRSRQCLQAADTLETSNCRGATYAAISTVCQLAFAGLGSCPAPEKIEAGDVSKPLKQRLQLLNCCQRRAACKEYRPAILQGQTMSSEGTWVTLPKMPG
jgi:hypothetical protein